MKDAARDARDHEASNLKFKFKFELTARPPVPLKLSKDVCMMTRI